MMADAKRCLRFALDLLREARWINRRSLMAGGVICAAILVYGLVRLFFFFTANGLAAPTGQPLAYDFLAFYSAAKAAAAGHAALAYDNPWLQAYQHTIVGPAANPAEIYAYPPIMLLLSLPLALFSYIPALLAWTLLGVGLVVALLRSLVGWRAAALAVIATPAAFFNLNFGQNGYFTAALFAGGLMAIERRPVIAGLCFGCLACKPQLGPLIPLAIAAGGYWRAFFASAATVAVLSLASLGIFGTAAWVGFEHNMAVHRAFIEAAPDLTRFPTTFAAARELGGAPPLAYAAQMLSGAAALLLTVTIWRRPGSFAIKAAVLIVATFLATPFAWDYDTLVLLFAAAWLGHEGIRTGFRPWERIAVLGLLLQPMLMFISARPWVIPVGPLVLALTLAVLAGRAFDLRLSPVVGAAARRGTPSAAANRP